MKMKYEAPVIEALNVNETECTNILRVNGVVYVRKDGCAQYSVINGVPVFMGPEACDCESGGDS